MILERATPSRFGYVECVDDRRNLHEIGSRPCDQINLLHLPSMKPEINRTPTRRRVFDRWVVSRLGLEPRALALKASTLLRKINAMTLRNRPVSDKPLQGVTVYVSYRTRLNVVYT